MVCRKIPYPTRRDAEQAKERGNHQVAQRPYLCECGYWHLSIRSKRAIKLAKKGRVLPAHPDRPGIIDRAQQPREEDHDHR